MNYVTLGKSGLRVSEFGLGTLTFGAQDIGAGRDESLRMYEAFRGAGGNFFDTADGYGGGRSEELLGEFVASERERVVLGTKFAMGVREGDPNSPTTNRKNLRESLEASLKRLGTDYIDLYWVHVWDPSTPLEELMRGLDDLVRAGKVHYVGISNTPAWVVARANTLAEQRGWTPFVGLQIPYSLMQRTVERELVPMAAALGLGVTAWGVLGGGILTGKYNQDRQARGRAAGSERISERALSVAATVVEIAGDLGCAASQVALNWVRQRECGALPLLGARSLAQLRENLSCMDFDLPPDCVRRLDEASRIELGFPAHFLEQERHALGARRR